MEHNFIKTCDKVVGKQKNEKERRLPFQFPEMLTAVSTT